jgi:hypothetical protein
MNDTAIIAGAGTTIDRYEALLRASTAIAAYRDSQAVVERFAKELQHFLDFDYVLITVIDEATHQISTRLFQAFGAEENIVLPDFQPDETPSGWVYDHQKPIVVSDWLGELSTSAGLSDAVQDPILVRPAAYYQAPARGGFCGRGRAPQRVLRGRSALPVLGSRSHRPGGG